MFIRYRTIIVFGEYTIFITVQKKKNEKNRAWYGRTVLILKTKTTYVILLLLLLCAICTRLRTSRFRDDATPIFRPHFDCVRSTFSSCPCHRGARSPGKSLNFSFSSLSISCFGHLLTIVYNNNDSCTIRLISRRDL